MVEPGRVRDVAELAGLLKWQVPGVVTVTVGHGRDPGSVAAAERFVKDWEAGGGLVGEVVSWPEEAASWLRQARRFASGEPDAWVVIAGPAGWAGWAGMRSRLLHHTTWDPSRTLIAPANP
ncbi:hypothetical protein [Nonomuraea endophytica]|uniref:Universal stress protein n=1 Tax=Nonomuraea endophytica TaxID=714136 RepID=A0A7W8A8E7_9ACTN|nr:hypothetical protein [Nonomuraea endophytica]MBB5080148.1 hypothetical protein [Nonomuraea endophytica]